jgi:flavin-binding protein dodecin
VRRNINSPPTTEEEDTMAVVKVIELLAQSNKSWEDAAQQAVDAAAKSVRNIKAIYIENLQGVVEDQKIVGYRVDAKVSFVVE